MASQDNSSRLHEIVVRMFMGWRFKAYREEMDSSRNRIFETLGHIGRRPQGTDSRLQRKVRSFRVRILIIFFLNKTFMERMKNGRSRWNTSCGP